MQKNNRVVKSVLILSIVFCSMLFVVSAAAYTEYTQKTVYNQTIKPIVTSVSKFVEEQKQLSADLKKAQIQAEQLKKQKQEEIGKQRLKELQQNSTKPTVNTSKQQVKQYNYTAPKPTNPPLDNTNSLYQDDYEERVKKMREEADKRYEKALEEQQKWAEEQKKASQERMDALREQNQKDLEEWKKEHGF